MVKKLDRKYLINAIDVLKNVGIKLIRKDIIDVFDKENPMKVIDIDIEGTRKSLSKMAWARINYIVERGKEKPRGEVDSLELYTQFMKDTLEARAVYETKDGELLYVVIDENIYSRFGKNYYGAYVWSIYDEDFIYEKASDDAKAIPELFWKLPKEEEKGTQ